MRTATGGGTDPRLTPAHAEGTKLTFHFHARSIRSTIDRNWGPTLVLEEETLAEATPIEQWAFFLLFADQYEPERLREVLPAVPFQQAVSAVQEIASKTEDRVMYDQREKAQRDYLSALAGARRDGHEEGRQEGREEGLLVGKIQLIQQLLDEESIPSESLLGRTMQELSSLLNELQERLRSRGH